MVGVQSANIVIEVANGVRNPRGFAGETIADNVVCDRIASGGSLPVETEGVIVGGHHTEVLDRCAVHIGGELTEDLTAAAIGAVGSCPDIVMCVAAQTGEGVRVATDNNAVESSGDVVGLSDIKHHIDVRVAGVGPSNGGLAIGVGAAAQVHHSGAAAGT